MTDFTITETGRTLPGYSTGVHGRISTETGQDAMYRMLAELGGTFAGLGEMIYNKQGVAEFTQKMFESKETFIQLRKEIAQETDPDKIWQAFENYKNTIEATEVKNGVARDMWQRAMPTMLDSQAKVILTDWERQVDDGYKWAVSNLEAQAIQSNDIPRLKKRLKNDVKKGLMLEDEMEVIISDATEKARVRATTKQYELAMAWVGENPEEALEMFSSAIKTGKLEGYPGPSDLLDAGHWRALRNIAQHDVQSIGKQEENFSLQEQQNEVNRLSVKLMNPDELLSPRDVELSEKLGMYHEQWRQIARGQTKPNPKTNWKKYAELEPLLFDYWNEMPEMNVAELKTRLAVARYVDRTISDNEYREIMSRIDVSFPDEMRMNLRDVFQSVRDASGWWYSQADAELNARVNKAVLSWTAKRLEQNKEPSKTDLLEKALELRAGRPRYAGRTFPPTPEGWTVPEPESVEQFENMVRQIYRSSPSAARIYYDKYIGRFE